MTAWHSLQISPSPLSPIPTQLTTQANLLMALDFQRVEQMWVLVAISECQPFYNDCLDPV